jgi:uncharacterized protein YciI
MLQFVITGKDGTGPEALDLRMSVRPLHLDGVRKLKENNNYVVGGATLDKEGKMNGSIMIVQFENEEDLKQWMKNEPYITGDVWQHIDVKPFKVADV